MSLSSEQLQLASTIDARVLKLERSGADDVTIFAAMADLMPDFKTTLLPDQRAVDELCARFDGFFRYAKILERIAGAIQSGQIKVP